MARNKHPEETVQKILDVSMALFLEKGYEHTTIQDIVDALGMSKGAVYHHFKSKEDIYDRISDTYYERLGWTKDLTSLPGENGLEKIRNLLCFLLTDQEKLALDLACATVSLNPKLIALALESSIRDAAPLLEQLIREGNADGSLHVAQPHESAEAFMILMNMWVGIFTTSREDFQAKLSFFQDFCSRQGLPVFSAQVWDAALAYYDRIMSARESSGS